MIDFNPRRNIERMIIYNGQAGASWRWDVEDDLVQFPVLSQGSFVTMRYQLSGYTEGRLALIVTSGLLASRLRVSRPFSARHTYISSHPCWSPFRWYSVTANRTYLVHGNHLSLVASVVALRMSAVPSS